MVTTTARGVQVPNVFEVAGEISLFGVRSLSNSFRRPFDGDQIVRQLAEVGSQSLPLIVASGFALGVVMTLHTRSTLVMFGATAVIPTVQAFAFFLEIGPLVTALLVAGRVGSGIGAVLADMRSTEQIDSLESLSIDSFKFLVVPRIIACTLALPVLTLFMDFSGLLGGKRLFEGEDLTETLAAVVKERPDLSEVPTPARRLIERCIEKDPRMRLRDIGDWELLLGDGSPAAAGPHSSRLPWIAAGALAVALALALWSPWRQQKQVDRPLTRLDVDLGEDVSLPPPQPTGSEIAISPDGTRLVYVSGTLPATKLFLRRLDQAQATELSGTQGADNPFFSPDGQWVGFATQDKVMKISAEGGAAVPFGEIPNFGGASWAEGGSIIVSDALGKGLVRYSAAGGPPQPLPGFSTKDAAVGPQILPGGKAVLFTEAQMSMDVDQYTIDVVTLADGHRKIVARAGASARYVGARGQPGYLIYVNRTTLFAVPFDLDKLETRGTPVPVLDGVAISRDSGLAQFDCSPGADGHGVLVYRKAGANSGDLWTLEWVDAAGRTEALPVKPGAFRNPMVFPG